MILQKNKRTNSNLEIITHKTKDEGIRLPLKSGDDTELGVHVQHITHRRVTVKQHERHLTLKSCWTPVYVNKCTKNP